MPKFLVVISRIAREYQVAEFEVEANDEDHATELAYVADGLKFVADPDGGEVDYDDYNYEASPIDESDAEPEANAGTDADPGL